jgi:hypothetical protein
MTELEKCELAKSKGFTYCPVSGEIKGMYGKVLTRKDNKGYSSIALMIEGKNYSILGHRLAWYLHYGTLPINQVDHIDRDRSNNKIDNLRDVTSQQNHFNKKAIGYRMQRTTNTFTAYIALNRKQINLGTYKTKEEARNAYLKAKETYHIIA